MIRFLRPRKLISPVLQARMASNFMREPSGNPKFLRPTKETLDLLRVVEFSSFSDSQGSEVDPIAIHSDSDDPFDPDDLVGILDSHKNVDNGFEIRSSQQIDAALDKGGLLRISQTNRADSSLSWTLTKDLPLSALSPVKREPAIKSRNHLPFEPEASSSSKVENKASSRTEAPSQGFGHSEDLSIFLSPTGPNSPFKKPKLNLYAAQSRPFTTSATTKAMRELHPTIQLSTQRPTYPAQNDPGLGGSHLFPEPDRKIVRPIILSKEQEYVLQLARQGRSLFFTGSAGTGKSVLLKSIIKDLKQGKNVSVTASTGLAACNIGGITLHSFAGIGLGNGEVSDVIKNVRKNRKALRRWRETDVLVIDEVSMIDGRLFNKLDAVARAVRRRQSPFGGIQVVACGDFYQLPPVGKREFLPDGTETKEGAIFAFECPAWKEVIRSSIILKEVFRQKGDQTFIDMLNDMRNGLVTRQAEEEFLRLSRPLDCPAGIVPTELYATRNEVENANNMKLRGLEGNARSYSARDGGTLPPQARHQVLANFLAPQRLFLKENAQVMCIKNFDETLVNGSLGKVIAFVDRDTYMCTKIVEENPNISLEETKKLLKKEKVKFELSQKGDLQTVVDDANLEELSAKFNAPDSLLDSVFNFFYEHDSNAPGGTTIDQMTTEQLVEKNRQRKLSFIQKLQQSSKGEKYPLVRFLNPDGVTTRDVLIEPEMWTIEDDKTDQILVSRVQLPLMLAWALSIHKSQGQTLQKVKVDLSRIFENGQAYVALSRAVAREGLQVVNFERRKVKTHRIVEEFYESLSTTEDLADNFI